MNGEGWGTEKETATNLIAHCPGSCVVVVLLVVLVIVVLLVVVDVVVVILLAPRLVRSGCVASHIYGVMI